MKRFGLLDTAQVPGGGELRLFEDGEHFSIKIAGGGDLMSTRMHGSEDALARIACGRISTVAGPRILIGGLGMGFTLAEALRVLGPTARLQVAELVPEVVRWNRGPLGAHAGRPLDDPRVEVVEADVAALIRAARCAFDAILLDVDNGPDGLTQAGNDWLYSLAGLAAAKAALRGNGVLAVWSAHPDRQFVERLRQVGFDVDELTVRAHGNKGARHRIWLAVNVARPGPGRAGAVPAAKTARRRR
jgi:spermidine synthase